MADEEVNLYDDLLVNEDEDRKEAEIAKTKHIDDLEKDNTSLKAKIEELEAQNGSITKQNAVLRRNISVLYKTAKTEIGRKNVLLQELQRKYDEIVFRRTKMATKFLGSGSRHMESEVTNAASTSQIEGSSGKRKEPESDGVNLYALKRPKVFESTVESNSPVRNTCDKSPNATVAQEGLISSKNSHEMSFKQGLSDKERTLAHFTAKNTLFKEIAAVKQCVDISAKMVNRESAKIQVKNDGEDRNRGKPEKIRPTDEERNKKHRTQHKEDIGRIPSRETVRLVKEDVRVRHSIKTETSSHKRLKRSSRSCDHSKRSNSYGENVRKRSRSRSPRRHSRDHMNLSSSLHKDKSRR